MKGMDSVDSSIIVGVVIASVSAAIARGKAKLAIASWFLLAMTKNNVSPGGLLEEKPTHPKLQCCILLRIAVYGIISFAKHALVSIIISYK